MSEQPQTVRIDEIASEIISHDRTNMFYNYWSLYKQTAYLSDVKDFFFRSDPEEGYHNLAIIGDGKVVDIEGDDTNHSGNLGIIRLSSVARVFLRLHPFPNLAHAEDASLTLLISLLGQEGTGPYWGAKSSKEEERLRAFSRTLIQECGSQ